MAGFSELEWFVWLVSLTNETSACQISVKCDSSFISSQRDIVCMTQRSLMLMQLISQIFVVWASCGGSWFHDDNDALLVLSPTDQGVYHAFKFFGVQRVRAMEVNAHVHQQSTVILRKASFQSTPHFFVSTCNIITNYRI